MADIIHEFHTSKRTQADGQSRGFNIADFRAFRDNAGVLRNHDYILEIPFPTGPEGGGLLRTSTRNNTIRVMEFTCDSVNFPATGLVTYKVQRYGYGVNETKPTIPQFSELQATFLTDQNTDVWRFFTDWMRSIVNFDFAKNPITGGEMDVYEISYKPEYAVDMYLYIYDPYGTLVRKVGFREAYPTMVGDVALQWGAGNQLIRVPVSFTFFDWMEDVVPARPAPPPTPGMGPIK